MNKKKLLRVIEKLNKNIHSLDGETVKPKTTLLDILIAAKLTQNTTDISAFKAYNNLKSKFKKWDELISASVATIREQIKVCGLANMKSREIKNMLILMKKNYGKLNLDILKKYSNEKVYVELLKYHGIGVKIISCLIAFGLKRDVFPVDTHVHRVLNRLGIVKTSSQISTYEQVKDEIPLGKKLTFHKDLIKFGRNICRSNKPFCSECFLYKECVFELKEVYKNTVRKNPEAKDYNFIIFEHI